MKQILLLFIPLLAFSCTSKFYVAPKMADCVVSGRSSCYLVKSNPDDNWLMIPEDIQGFEYEDGFIYKIKVKKIHVKDGFNNTISAYRLVEVLSKEEFKKKKLTDSSAGFRGKILKLAKTGGESDEIITLLVLEK